MSEIKKYSEWVDLRSSRRKDLSPRTSTLGKEHQTPSKYHSKPSDAQ